VRAKRNCQSCGTGTSSLLLLLWADLRRTRSAPPTSRACWRRNWPP